MSDERTTRQSSMEKLRSKADSLRSLNLGSVDKNLSELDKQGTNPSQIDENNEEDDVAIAAAVAEIESELGARKGFSGGMYLAVLLAVLAYYFVDAREAAIKWLLEKVK